MSALDDATKGDPDEHGHHRAAACGDRGSVEVSTIGGDAVSVTFGDDLSGVRLLGPLIDVHQLVVEADRQLSRVRDR
jgi:hypothetical protein